MKSKSIKCEFCKTEISEPCQFAAYSTTIDGKQHVFCCVRCALRSEEAEKKL